MDYLMMFNKLAWYLEKLLSLTCYTKQSKFQMAQTLEHKKIKWNQKSNGVKYQDIDLEKDFWTCHKV